MQVNDYSVEKVNDPIGFIEGDRYEFRLYIMLDEEDDLYSEKGIGIRSIVAVNEGETRIAMAHFFERDTDKPLEFALEDDELASLLEFCKENLPV